MDKILTVQEVADYLKVSKRTVWRWCNEGKLTATKIGHSWRIQRSEVEKVLIEGLDDGGQALGEVEGPGQNMVDDGEDKAQGVGGEAQPEQEQ